MRTERLKAQIWGGILAFIAALGSTGCLISGMRMDNVSLGTTITVFAFAACLFSATLGFKGFPAIPALLLTTGIWLWFRGPLYHSLEALVYQCSFLYDMGYSIGTVRWSDTPAELLDPTLAVCLIGLMIMLCVSWTVARGKQSWTAVVLIFLPLVPCLFLTDTVPKPFYLFLQLLAILLLLLTGTVRKRSLSQGNALTALTLLPAVLALLALFFFMPQERYAGDIAAQKLEDWVISLLENTESPEKPDQTLPPVSVLPSRDRVNLGTVGPMWKLEIPVMHIAATQTGPLYLRERAYDTYDGTGWEEDENEGELPFFTDGGSSQTVHISTMLIHDYLYLPYGTQWLDNPAISAQSFFRGSIENTDNKKEYTVSYVPVDIYNSRLSNFYNAGTASGNHAYPSTGSPDRYLALVEETRIRAQAILAREIPDLHEMSVLNQAQAICSYVKSTAPYSLATPRMPQDADFALWFLEESDTGYCVHFATAAAVLLRAAGIPSRYVTGYLAEAQAGETVTVMEKSAHAWIEVNILGQWIMLEPTPADGVEQTMGTQSPETTEPSAGEETTTATETEESTLPPTSTESSAESTSPISGPPSVTAPVGGADSPTDPKEPFRLPVWAKALIWIVLCFGTVIGQWQLRVHLRRNRRRKGSSNAQALACWQDIQVYCKLLDKEPDPALHALALKAKFSQHKLAKEELYAFRVALDLARRNVWDRKVHIRLLATLIFALH